MQVAANRDRVAIYRKAATLRMAWRAHAALSREQERSALVQALLDGNLDQAGLWETADILRIPSRGTNVVIAAEVPAVGRRALPGRRWLCAR